MTLRKRLLVLCCCSLTVGVNAWAAGKRRPKPARGPAPAQIKNQDKSQDRNREGAGGTSSAVASKASTGPGQARPVSNQPPLRESVRQESRIEFDERMLKGQSAAGVIYLFQRTPSDWKSIVEVPDSFRARTTNVLATSGEEKK